MRLVAAAVFAALAAACADSPARAAGWTGTYTLPLGTEPVAISIDVHGAKATVALGAGHSGSTVVPVRASGDRIRLAFPGLPANMVFDGRVRGRALTGSVTQANLRGTLRLTRGASRVLPLHDPHPDRAHERLVLEPAAVPRLRARLLPGSRRLAPRARPGIALR